LLSSVCNLESELTPNRNPERQQALVYVSDEERLSLYQEGIAHRRNWILSDYRLPVDLIGKDDVVIDIGANIGELGLWVTERGGRYIAFEPDPRAYWALENNMPNGELHRLALSDRIGVAEFYLSTANADSSLFKPLIVDEVLNVETSTLDAFFENTNKPSKIRLLKVEAEGMEPEILSGALKTLESVEYVAVDAGPERGGDNTVPGVFSVLVDANFEVIDSFLLRGTFLFRRRSLIDH